MTSCLSTTAETALAAPGATDASPTDKGHEPSTLPNQQYDLLTLSIHQIVDEFFSPVQKPLAKSAAPAPSPVAPPAVSAALQHRVAEPVFIPPSHYSILKYSAGRLAEGFMTAAGNALIPVAQADPPVYSYQAPTDGIYHVQMNVQASAQTNCQVQLGPTEIIHNQPCSCDTVNHSQLNILIYPHVGPYDPVASLNPLTPQYPYSITGSTFLEGFVLNNGLQGSTNDPGKRNGTGPIPGSYGTGASYISAGDTNKWEVLQPNGKNVAEDIANDVCNALLNSPNVDPAIFRRGVQIEWDDNWTVPGWSPPSGPPVCAQGLTDPKTGVVPVTSGVILCGFQYPEYPYPDAPYPYPYPYADSYHDSLYQKPIVTGYAESYAVGIGYDSYATPVGSESYTTGVESAPTGECYDDNNCYGESIGHHGTGGYTLGGGYYFCDPLYYMTLPDSGGDAPDGGGDCATSGGGGMDVGADDACGGLMATDGCMAFENPVGDGGTGAGGPGGGGCGDDDGGAGNEDTPPDPIYYYYDTYYDTGYDAFYDTYYDTGVCTDYCYEGYPIGYESYPPESSPETYYSYPCDAYVPYYDSAYQYVEYYEYPHRLADAPPVVAVSRDTRFRDACLAGAPLVQQDFDPATGNVTHFIDPITGYVTPVVDPKLWNLGPYDYTPDSTPDSLTQFDEQIAGNVSGVKPTQPAAPDFACMPAKDTPKISLDKDSLAENPDIAFAYFLNMGDNPFTNDAVYNTKNYYRNNTFFISPVMPDPASTQIEACPDLVAKPVGIDGDPVALAEYHRAQADNCYTYYILNHSITPWFTLERPLGGTDDPLSILKMNRAIVDNCQPLINGSEALTLEVDAWKKNSPDTATRQSVAGIDLSGEENNSGYSPVIRGTNRPDYDEAEYLLSTYLQKTWDKNFNSDTVTGPDGSSYKLNSKQSTKFPDIGLPCVQDPLKKSLQDGDFPSPPSHLPPSTIGPVCSNTPTQGDSAPNCPPYRVIPGDPGYKSPTTDKMTYYCPNVEKIIEPGSPFSPRDDMAKQSPDGKVTPHTKSFKTIFDPLTGAPTFSGPTDKPFATITDRDYSYLTSQMTGVLDGNNCNAQKLAWSNFNATGADDTRTNTSFLPYIRDASGGLTGDQIGAVQMDTDDAPPANGWKQSHPVVQCGIVPVDILSFRSAQFDNCMMQRIDINYNAWIDQGYPDPFDPSDLDRMHPANGTNFKPPCATRFWEKDDLSGCAVKMSIQQCCHIITKDLVPANFVKMRTCEGLLDRRRRDDNTSLYFSNLQSNIQLNTDSHFSTDPVVNITDVPLWWNSAVKFGIVDWPSTVAMNFGDVSGMYTGASSYHATDTTQTSKYLEALRASVMLNDYSPEATDNLPLGCSGREPDEYRFTHWFEPFWLQNDPTADTADITDDTYNPIEAAHSDISGQLNGLAAEQTQLVGYHMPYMRWWDTGTSAGQAYHGGSFINTLGSFDTIIGVGREERDRNDAGDMQGKAVSAAGSLVDSTRLGNFQPSQMGRIGGWSELKGHEMQTIRHDNLFCIGRYEKLFKPGSAEEYVLGRAGGGYSPVKGLPVPWPLAWRGYVTDSYGLQDPDDPTYTEFTNYGYPVNQFPNVGMLDSTHAPVSVDDFDPPYSVTYKTGLDNAAIGDIIIYTFNQVPQVAYVTGVHLPPDICAASVVKDSPGPEQKNCWITVQSWDQGKFPTITGSSLSSGIGMQRSVYEYLIPGNTYIDPTKLIDVTALDGYLFAQNGHGQPTCIDPYASICVWPDALTGAGGIDPSTGKTLPSGVIDTGWGDVKIYSPNSTAPCDPTNPEAGMCSTAASDIRRCTWYMNPPWIDRLTTPPTITAAYATDPHKGNYTLDGTYGYFGWSCPNPDPVTGCPATLPQGNDNYILEPYTNRITTDLWAYCRNAGFDPPPSYNKDYNGAGTGSFTGTHFCGPGWYACSSASSDPTTDTLYPNRSKH